MIKVGLVFSISIFVITRTSPANKWMRKKIPSCSNSASRGKHCQHPLPKVENIFLVFHNTINLPCLCLWSHILEQFPWQFMCHFWSYLLLPIYGKHNLIGRRRITIRAVGNWGQRGQRGLGVGGNYPSIFWRNIKAFAPSPPWFLELPTVLQIGIVAIQCSSSTHL